MGGGVYYMLSMVPGDGDAEHRQNMIGSHLLQLERGTHTSGSTYTDRVPKPGTSLAGETLSETGICLCLPLAPNLWQMADLGEVLHLRDVSMVS